jgi:hypothetical protein
MTLKNTPLLKDNASALKSKDKYTLIDIDVQKVVKSWKASLFSFEWLTPEGDIKTAAQLPEAEREKFEAVFSDIETEKALERPILGIGIMDNIEIGSRRDVLLTLASQNVQSLSVHINKADKKDFEPFLHKN